LDRCERALTEYLDLKKSRFPRFYFVSNAALVDILASSSSPPGVMPHMSACFDALTNLNLEPSGDVPADTGDKPRKPVPNCATALVAKDGEMVVLDKPFRLEGPVESWLHDVVLLMQTTLKQQLELALEGASMWEIDVSRDNWVYIYPAQCAIIASQICFTEEVEKALEETEAGSEDAMRNYLAVCNNRLNMLISQVRS
jgi:dynein heavy chain